MGREKIDIENLEQLKGCFLVDTEALHGDVVFCYDVLQGFVETFSSSWAYSPFYNIEDPDELSIYEMTTDPEDIKVFVFRNGSHSINDIHEAWEKENGEIDLKEMEIIFEKIKPYLKK